MKKMITAVAALLLLAACIDPAQRATDKYMSTLDASVHGGNGSYATAHRTSDGTDTAALRDITPAASEDKAR